MSRLATSTPPLAHLTHQVRTHYALRGFSSVVINMLCAEIGDRSSEAGLRIAAGRWESIERLLGVFEPIEQTPEPASLHPEPIAIFALSFGYRLDSPFASRPEDRQPGRNNLAIATQLERCQRIFPNAWVAAQYEIGLAREMAKHLAPSGEEAGTPPNFVSPARDWTTAEVLACFMDNVLRRDLHGNRSILVVCHRHHFGRCAFHLARAGFEGLIAPKEAVAYDQYDEREAQPRFRSAWEYLLNDFLSLCNASRVLPELSNPTNNHSRGRDI